MAHLNFYLHRCVMKTNKLFLKVCNRNEANSKNVIFSENIFTILDLLTAELNVIIVIFTIIYYLHWML